MTEEHSEPQQDVHDASGDDRLHGILVQVAADRSLSPELDVRAAIADRLRDQQIAVDGHELDELVRSLPGVPGDEPGPFVQGSGQTDADAR